MSKEAYKVIDLEKYNISKTNLTNEGYIEKEPVDNVLEILYTITGEIITPIPISEPEQIAIRKPQIPSTKSSRLNELKGLERISWEELKWE